MAKRKNDAEAVETVVEETAVTEQETAEETKEDIKEAETLIYLGPTIAGTGIIYGKAYSGGLPAYAKEFISKYPEAKDLFVGLENLIESKRKIAAKGTYLNTMVRELIKKTGGR